MTSPRTVAPRADKEHHVSTDDGASPSGLIDVMIAELRD